MSEGSVPAGFTTIQGLVWPERGVCTERDLYLRLNGPASLSNSRREVVFSRTGFAQFNSWFNLFNLGKWRRCCDLRTLGLRLEGSGRFEVAVFLVSPHRSWERWDEVVTLEEGTPARIDLGGMIAECDGAGLLYFELRALRSGRLTGGGWETADPARRAVDLMLSVTTFRREAEVARTVQRFESYIADSPLRDGIRMTVVDNGQSLELAPSPHVTVIANENLGGAGGFSRGLLAARDSGATHCLFMDDDASTHMESLERTWQFLAYATDPATAVAGAMINASHRWAIWENGALFDQRCQPLHMGTDLRDAGQSFAMEFATTGRAPDKFYGGWWYFAFPVERVTHQPFPFFVRGDDVSFSLVHDFDIVTLNGVVSFQDSFTDKESPLTWYLDLRSHLAHHLSLPAMQIGRLRALKIAVWFFLRNLPRMHYETLEAISIALEDVQKGPAFFDENADMATRRADMKALTRAEAWGPAWQAGPDRIRFNPENRLWRLLMKMTLNGHLLPFFRHYGNRVTIEAQDRSSLRRTWGAAEITYLSADGQRSYTVRHSKRALLARGLRFGRAAIGFLRDYDRLQVDWRAGYMRLTAEPYWREKLGMTGGTPETAPKEQDRQTA